MTTSPRRERRSALPLPLADQTVFSFRFTASPRGARLARRLASCQMDAWGWRHGTPAHDSVELIVAELAANAVTHGRVPGRCGPWCPPCWPIDETGTALGPSVAVPGLDDHDFLLGGPVDEAVLVVDPA